MPELFHVVDLFAGPGGLAEGFSTFTEPSGHAPFNVVLSIEREAAAHRTLRLRSFLRQFEGDIPTEYYDWLNGGGQEPDWADLYPSEWEDACAEALRLELGDPAHDTIVHEKVGLIASTAFRSVVIGGPPCQAYSLAGRVRNLGVEGYVPEEDRRHYLYEEYIGILELLRPDAFVMENVKGMLSSSVAGARIFDRVLDDLRNVGAPHAYDLFAIARSPSGGMTLQRAESHGDYVVRSERFGVPQARHRVIVIGLRADLAREIAADEAAPPPATLRHVLGGMPALRSGLSKDDDAVAWLRVMREQVGRVEEAVDGLDEPARSRMLDRLHGLGGNFAESAEPPPRESRGASPLPADCPASLRDFLTDPFLKVTTNHSSRGHMQSDLGRYLFASVFNDVMGAAPKAHQFPSALAPAHLNWETGKFSDRFRVQRWDSWATTVTSHISKDGHYFIHPDPAQCRSLTVREAARLQTFPDNYFFHGNRTEQYVQVGNAVPPYLARQIAAALWRALA